MGAGKLLWGYYPATKAWIPLQVDENGKVIVDMSAINLDDLGDVNAPAPGDGDALVWDDATGRWIPGAGAAFACADLAACSIGALGDVTIAALVDGHFLSYSAGLGYWQNRLLAEADIPAAIARDAEVAAAVAAEATARAAAIAAHNALVPSSTVHYDSSLCRYYLSADQANIPSGKAARIELNTLLYDLGSNFTTADWYGAEGAYRQADADSDATHIQDDDADFPPQYSSQGILTSLVRWASNAAGTLNVGTGYVTGAVAATLTIVKATGADFAASYYYWIKKSHYVTPVTGYYLVIGNERYDPTEDQKRYNTALYKGDIAIMNDSRHASGTSAMGSTVLAFAYLEAGDSLCLKTSAMGLAGTLTVKGGATEEYASYTSLMVKLLQEA